MNAHAPVERRLLLVQDRSSLLEVRTLLGFGFGRAVDGNRICGSFTDLLNGDIVYQCLFVHSRFRGGPTDDRADGTDNNDSSHSALMLLS